jgi:uncharacterized OB-fold protein
MQCSCGGNTTDRQKTVGGKKYTFTECTKCGRALVPKDLSEALKAKPEDLIRQDNHG